MAFERRSQLVVERRFGDASIGQAAHIGRDAKILPADIEADARTSR